MKDKKKSGIKEMWAFKVELAKYIKFIKPGYEISLPKDQVKDALFSHIGQIVTDTIHDFYFKKPK